MLGNDSPGRRRGTAARHRRTRPARRERTASGSLCLTEPRRTSAGSGPRRRPAAPYLPSAPPCYCGRGGRVNPGSRFLRVPFRQRRRASAPTSGAGRGRDPGCPAPPPSWGSEGRGFTADILSEASRPPSSMRLPGRRHSGGGYGAAAAHGGVSARPAGICQPPLPCSYPAPSLRQLAGRVSAGLVTGWRCPGQTLESAKCQLRCRGMKWVC